MGYLKRIFALLLAMAMLLSAVGVAEDDVLEMSASEPEAVEQTTPEPEPEPEVVEESTPEPEPEATEEPTPEPIPEVTEQPTQEPAVTEQPAQEPEPQQPDVVETVPEAAEEERTPITALDVRLERIDETALYAAVTANGDGIINYQWMVASIDVDTSDWSQWGFINGAVENVFDAQETFGEQYYAYSYRCVVTAGELSAISEEWRFEAPAAEEPTREPIAVPTDEPGLENEIAVVDYSWDCDEYGHEYIDGVCEYCNYECPHVETRIEYDIKGSMRDSEYKSVPLNDEYHITYYDIVTYEVCLECYDTVGEEKTYLENGGSNYFGRHKYESYDENDDIITSEACLQCGYNPSMAGSYECPHGRLSTWYDYDESECTITYIDDRTHKITGTITIGTDCGICHSTIYEETVSEAVKIHDIWEGNYCIFCGREVEEIACFHENFTVHPSGGDLISNCCININDPDYHEYHVFYGWVECNDCGEQWDQDIDYVMQEAHAFANGSITCVLCGYEAADDDGDDSDDDCPHDRDWDVPPTYVNLKYHTYECVYCGETVYEDHNVECTDPNICTQCGGEASVDYVFHYFDDDWGYDANYHWRTCTECGEIEKEKHFGYCYEEDDLRCYFCEQSAKDVNVEVQHSWNWDEAIPADNGVEHYYECEYCGLDVNYEEHYATCKDPDHCRECGADYDGYVGHYYSGDSWQYYDEYSHVTYCFDCGEPIYDEHRASCSSTNKNVCTLCGEGEPQYVYHEADYDNPISDADGHWYMCEICGEDVYWSEHYTYCYDTPGICSECGTAYTGGYMSHDESYWEGPVVGSDDDFHWRECSACGELNREGHYSTCGKANGTCAECGKPAQTVWHDYDTWGHDGSLHWMECTNCGIKVNVSDHYVSCAGKGAKNAYCEACGAEVGDDAEVFHNYYSAKYKNATLHTYTCVDCGQTEDVKHYASCDSPKVCADCGRTGTIAGVFHGAEAAKSNAEEHWYICSECGKEIYRGEHLVACYSDGTCVNCGNKVSAEVTLHAYVDGVCIFCKDEKPVPVTKITLSKTSLSIVRGYTAELTATIAPEGASNQKLVWTSSDETIATVEDGVVTGVKAGTATITCTAADGSGVKTTCKVTVSNPPKPTKVAITAEKTTLDVDEELQLVIAYTPAQAESTLTWKSSDTAIATVDENGMVKGISDGTVTITVTTANKLSASVKLTVVDPTIPTGIVLVDENGNSIGSDLSLEVGGESRTIYYKLEPEGAYSDVKWAYSNNRAIDCEYEIDSEFNSISAEIFPKKQGTDTLTARTVRGGKTATMSITVKNPALPEKIQLNEMEDRLIYIGDQMDLGCSVEPANAKGSLIWDSSNPDAVDVTGDGHLYAIAEGIATITVSSFDNPDVYDSVQITVADPAKPQSVSLNVGETHELNVKESLQLVPTILPAREELDTRVTWATSDKTIATVDENGLVTPLKAGKVTITVKTVSMGKTAQVKITVVDEIPAESITLTPKVPADLFVSGETLTLEAEVLPASSTSRVNWTSSNASVAAVDANGVVTPLKAGSATITAKTSNGKTDTVKVNVFDMAPAKTVAIVKPESSELYYGDALTLTANALTAAGEKATSTVTWSSSNKAIATVDATGLVTAQSKEGSVTITAKIPNGKTAKVTLKVYDPKKPRSITLKDSNGKLTGTLSGTISWNINEYLILEPVISPATAESDITWSSSDKKIATVEGGPDSCWITFKKTGKVTITAKTKVAGKTAKVTINVKDPEPATGITIENKPENNTIFIGEEHQLTAKLPTKSGATSTSLVTWTSSNTGIATVYEGLVQPKTKEGTVTITATTSNGKKTTYKLNVVSRNKPTRLELIGGSAIDCEVNEIKELWATLYPSTADGEVTWTSSNTKIAKVIHSEGTLSLISFLKTGKVTITAKTTVGGKTAKVTINVKDSRKATKVAINQPESKELYYGEMLNLSTTLTPADSTSKITWTSSNTKIAKVNEDGVVTAQKKEGSVTITAKATSGKTDKITLKVYNPLKPKSVSLNVGPTIEYNINEILTLKPTMQPAIAESAFTWTSSNKSIATVSNGVVTFLKTGKVTITVKTKVGSKTAKVTINVVDPKPAASLTLEETGTLLLLKGNTQHLHASALTENNEIATSLVTWSSSDKKIATVSPEGLVTGVKKGTVTITVMTSNGKKASVKVKVN